MPGYICDRKVPACAGLCLCESGSACSHTFNPDHALYGPCADPQNHPERFEFWPPLDDYWEKDDYHGPDRH